RPRHLQSQKILKDQAIQDEVQLPTSVEANEDLQDEVSDTNQSSSFTSKNVAVVDQLLYIPGNSTISNLLIDLSFSSNTVDNPSSSD
ncbi:unnamed protein product, partial [Didymodactylos carnosus]